MSYAESFRQLRVLTDPSTSLAERTSAAHKLRASDDPAVLRGLIAVAVSETPDQSLAAAAGESIALILLRTDRVDQVPLHDFATAAYLAYDRAVAGAFSSR
jgi:hypothetical protein